MALMSFIVPEKWSSMQNLTKVTGAQNVGQSNPRPVHLNCTSQDEYTGKIMTIISCIVQCETKPKSLECEI